jgi:hypothetical protein
MKQKLLATLILLTAAQFTWASIIFDDFNVNEGHFNVHPTFSGSTSGIATTSTADRTLTPSPLEGAAFERLVMPVITTSTTRVRFLSGSGTPANNVSFTTSASTTDGWIGLYVRTSTSGWKVAINLDSTANTSGTMLGSTQATITGDGAWHLYEWNLDGTTWGQVAGIGGYTSMAAALAAGDPHPWTIDSLYLLGPSGQNGQTITIDLDFVAKSDSGSISALIPEPSSAALAILGGLGLLAARFRRS